MSLPDSRPSLKLLYGALLLSTVVWAAATVIGKVTVTHFPVFTTLFLRFCLASLLLVPLFLRDRHRQLIKPGDWWKLISLGVVGFGVSIGLFFVGIQKASVMDASVLYALGPMMISLCAWVFLKERFHIYNLLGLSLAGFGVILALTWNATSAHHSWWGDMAILGSEISGVAYTIGSKEILKRYSALTVTTISFVVAMLCFAPLSLMEILTQPTGFTWTGSALWGILYLALFSSVLAYWLYEWSLNYLAASTVGALSYLQPLGSIVLAMIFLGEEPTWGYAVGGVLTIMGVIIAVNQPHFKHRTAKEVHHTRHSHRRI